MLNRYKIYFFSATLALGSIFASDLDLECQVQEEIAFQNSKKNQGESAPTCSKTGALAKKCSKVPDVIPEPMLFLQPCPASWRFSADFLYFMPTVDDTYFAINSPIIGTFTLLGTRSNNNYGFKPGFRVGTEYAFCETRRDIQAFYTYLHAEQKKTLSGDNLWATVGSTSFSGPFTDYSGSASSKLKLLYQRLDVNVSQHIIDAHGFNFYVQPGIEYAYLRQQQSYHFDIVDFPGTVQQQSRVWAVGPQLGLGFDAHLYQGSIDSCGPKCSVDHAVTISGLFSSSILTGLGETRELDQREGTTTNDVRDQQAWRTIPAMHAKMGLAYRVEGTNMGASLFVGYEFSTYIRGLAKMTFPSTASTANIVTNYYNFDVQGLDVSFAITF